jgi:hypothetical protein
MVRSGGFWKMGGVVCVVTYFVAINYVTEVSKSIINNY